MISFNFHNCHPFPIPKNKLKASLRLIAAHYDVKIVDLNYIFVDDTEILRINNEFLHHNYLTDIITFDYASDRLVSGDVYVCPHVVLSNSKDFNVDYGNELKRVLCHGLLHLIGFKDKSKSEIKAMRAAEDFGIELMNFDIVVPRGTSYDL